jgi:hypothetical protein
LNTFGGNLPGASHAWPEASHADRIAMTDWPVDSVA